MNKPARLSRRLIAFLASILLIVAAFPFTASAVDPQVYDLDGYRTVFLSTLARINYGGDVRGVYRKFEDAMAALGTEGGRVIISSIIEVDSFTDIPGRAPVMIYGSGTINSCVLKFADHARISLGGDLMIRSAGLNVFEDFVIETNGYSFEVDSLSATARKPYTVYSGDTLNYSTSSVRLDGGTFSVVGLTSGSVGADCYLNFGKSTVLNAYAGSVEAGDHSIHGNVLFTAKNGTDLLHLYAGPAAKGKVSGNVVVSLNGATVTSLVPSPATAEGRVEGNVAIISKSSTVKEFGASVDGTVGGKVIYITDDEASAASVKADYTVVVKNGSAEPAFDGNTLIGFRFTDENGIYTSSAADASGAPLAANAGIFALPAGKSVVTVTPSVKLAVDPNASYVSGYEDGTFLPQKNVSRAEAITMLSRLIVDENALKAASGDSAFADVPFGSWYEPYVALFEKLGFLDTISGDAGSKIYPNQLINRGEFCELVIRVTEFIGGRSYSVVGFPDVPAANPYRKAIGEAGYLGLVGGYEDGSFGPTRNITRAEVVTIINRLLGRTPTDNAAGKTFSDVGDHWAAPQIRIAANPAEVDGSKVWTSEGYIIEGKYQLLSGDSVTIADQIEAFYKAAPSLPAFSKVKAIDDLSHWQIDKIAYSESDLSSVTGTCYYISPNGDDKNDGTSPEKAWKTLNRLSKSDMNNILKAGDAVLFERGGLWRGNLNTKNGITYSAYGKGEKPRIYGSKQNYADESLWEETKYENVWKLTKSITQDVGVIIFDSTEEIGNYHELYGDKVITEKGADVANLRNDLNFGFYGSKVYLYSVENPGKRFHSIEIGSNGSLVSIADNVVIDNLHFRYTGGHVIGTGNKKNVTCKNCIFAYTGGSILSGKTRYGNAFESYGGCDGWYAYNNWMYQIYDTGVTHQYTPTTGNCVQKNVEYAGNVIELCHWCIEYYNHDSTDGSSRLVQNVNIHDNICRLAGYGWGSITAHRQSSATMYQSAGITKNTKDYISKHNILDRSAGNIINGSSDGDKKATFEENIYVQSNGGTIGGIRGLGCKNDETSRQALKDQQLVPEEEPLFIVDDTHYVVDYIVKY